MATEGVELSCERIEYNGGDQTVPISPPITTLRSLTMENLMPTQESKRAVIDVSTTFAPDSRVKDAAPDTIIYTR
ncbi:hypothetical protein FRB95_000651 [Tulasnella sp. JGI-2019a]|nr:hypothetical protein FRB95_000651 [Tulasnella sp. JGI-2019a]